MKTKEYIEKAKEIMYKFRYVLEFILFGIFAVYLNQLLYLKDTQGFLHREYLIVVIMYAILSLFFIIYNLKNCKKKIEKIFLTIMIPIGLLYFVFLLPTYAPDEPPHMWKAYEISTGKLVTDLDENGKSSTMIPRELADYGISKFKKYKDIDIFTSTDYSDEVEINTPAQGYPFFLYIFSALGFLISRVFNLSILLGAYIGRLFNFIVFLVVGYFAIKKVPFGKIALSTFLFLPMMLQQAISFSADAFTNCITIFFIANTLNLVFKKEKITTREKVVTLILALLTAMSKIVYVPIIGIMFLFCTRKDMTKKEKTIFITLTVIISAICALGMFAFTSMYTSESMQPYLQENNVNVKEQAVNILQHPIYFVKILCGDMYIYGETYVYMMIGMNLGWFNIGINHPIITLFLLTLLASIFVEKNEIALDKKQRIWNLILSVLSIILVQTAMYLTWTTVGKGTIDGIQGRYFIPIVLFIMLSLAPKKNYIKFKNIEYVIPIIMTVLNLLTIGIIYKFFV